MLFFLLTFSSEVCCQTALGYMSSGKTKLEKQDYRGAISDFTRAIEIDPQIVLVGGTHFLKEESTNSKYKSNQTSIYSFLKKNNLTVKSEQDFYMTYSDPTKAKELYDFFVKNKLTFDDFTLFYEDILAEKSNSTKSITYKEFSAKIKKKYPEYKDVDDLLLAEKMLEKYPVYKDRVIFDQPNNSTIKLFKVGEKILAIPNTKVKAFLNDIPNAIEIQSFQVDKDTFDIPIEKVPEFLNDLPNAQRLIAYDYTNYILKLHKYLTKKENFNVPLEKFLMEMQNEENLNRIYSNLKEKDGFSLSLNHFKHIINGDRLRFTEGVILYFDFFVADPIDRLRLLFDYLEQNNPKLKNYGFESFCNDMENDSLSSQVYEGLSSKYPEWRAMGYDTFKKDLLHGDKSDKQIPVMLNEYRAQIYNVLKGQLKESFDKTPEQFDSLMNDTAYVGKVYNALKGELGDSFDKTYDEFLILVNPKQQQQPTEDYGSSGRINLLGGYQIDKIKVGNSYIELPFPSGFVKVDDSMGNLLEAAKKLCPETNTLLAYYVSQEDYANYLVYENHVCEKYILVQVFNELKDTKVGAKDYRQFLKKHKEEYIDEFKLKIDDAEIKASENLSKIDERLKMKDFNIEPFGICYESKYSLSYGILTKYNFTVDYENSEDYIVAGISTITKIDKKPIFLFLYKTYNGSEDIQSLKALNTSWIEEIDKRQGPGSFLAEIDFEDYKESILAILTLSFIWAIYFATKKIHRKLKNTSEKKVAKVEEKNEFLDFNELLHEDVKINDELAVEEKVIVSQIKPESSKESFKVSNPEYLKVNRRTRFYNWLIDAILFYFIIYLPLFLYNAIINTYLYLLIIFLYYFIQELLFRKTIGKFVTKTHVVNNLGLKPTVLQLILRNASRLIPFEAFTYFSKEKRGLHDIFSKTYVIKD